MSDPTSQYQNPRITVGFLLFPGFPMSCLTSAIEPLRAANDITGTQTFSWVLLSEEGDAVQSSADIPFQANCALADAPDLDMLFLMSSPSGTFTSPKSSNGHLRKIARHGAIVGAVSGGIFPLAHAGLLDGYSCSAHWCYSAAFSEAFPHLQLSDSLIQMDKRRYTASGAGAMFDLMLHVIEDTLGATLMTEVACWFQHPVIRSEGVRQKTPAFACDSTADGLPPIVSKAVELFDQNLAYPLPMSEIADQLGVSARHLERSFKATMGESPGKHYRDLRMRAARQMVLYSNDPISRIAHAVGYETSATMIRNYRRCFGLSPQEDRRNMNPFRVTAADRVSRH
ncbi:GlxA family transcriptional regulator [Tropicibacter sp. R16_0]|uniref:GlxA family transcriptional regulator n=1 Tax=Tropicibacter sp. R16_0 TaxID=2821102 RepID=UPI001ADC9F79|nr:GlxA family transcriptional regulator [Tropicibacter sp. R16_0]MBO9451112.1 GlxA family transcriptional regulator [Tropicibacter sp. R16_0]